MKKILIVEDSKSISTALKYSLEQECLEVNVADNLKCAKEEFSKNKYDCIILDVTLPDGNGFELCRYVKEKSDTSVIFLTAKDEEKDVVLGLDMGADDYVIKPFRTRELISRINNVLRRNETNNNEIICGKVKIYIDSTKVLVNDKEVVFTALEYKLLVFLYMNKNRTVTREQVLDKIWDESGNFVNDNTLTVYIKRIRKKLGKADNIKTIKGIGYRVDD